jgi:folate-binding protein YgfZ
MSLFEPESDTPASPSAAHRSGVVRVTGRDALSLFHNISTQQMLDLSPGDARLALFCDFRGRLAHRVVAARVADGSVWLVREDQPGDALAAHLDRSVFREDVSIEDLTASFRVTPQFVADDAPAGVTEADDHPVRIHALGTPEYQVVPDAEPGEPARFDIDGWERERIGRGWARQDHEVTSEFHPFEVNLGHGVHLDKGCFTGQETLMRLVTYHSVRRRLVRLEGDGPAPAPGAIHDDEGVGIGSLTSVQINGAIWTALAVLRREACEGAETIELDGERRARIAEVFPWRSPAGRPLGF